MRRPEYLSPSSLKMWYSDRKQYYFNYLCETRLSRMPQTEPMSVGSAFDAYVKSFMVERLIGKRPEFEFDTLFPAQVEEHNRDWARIAGKHCFDTYKKLGALHDIFGDIQGCVGVPRFEASIKGYVQANIRTIPFHGKPDLYFITSKGVRVIFDWKVNGYCSQASPKPGYVRIRTEDKNNGNVHPDCNLTYRNGMRISGKYKLEDIEPDWAAQTSIYGWLLGEDVGADFVSAIDQLACKSDIFKVNPPTIRIAQHRCMISSEFQQKIFQMAHDAWDAIQTGHIFTDVDREVSDQYCAQLEEQAARPRDALWDEMMGNR